MGFTSSTSRLDCEAPRPQAGASRKGNIVFIAPLAGHLPATTRLTLHHLPVQYSVSNGALSDTLLTLQKAQPLHAGHRAPQRIEPSE
jgi:hypothetical protein